MFVPAIHAEHTIESLYAEQGRRVSWIYQLLLIGVIGALTSLPLIKIDVTVRAPGMVRPTTERMELRPAVSARIESVLARDNDTVVAGQPLLVLVAADWEQRQARAIQLRSDHQALVADLDRIMGLARHEEANPNPGFATAAIAQEYAQYRAQAVAAQLMASRAHLAWTRVDTLASQGLATRQELDNARYEVERGQAEIGLLLAQSLNRWQARLREETVALAEAASELGRLETERPQYTLCAPSSGVVMGLTGLGPGGYVSAGQTLGVISPDESLCIETQVLSRDAGLIRPKQRVRMQIDAYPYTEWGTLGGTVTSISGDWIGAAGSGVLSPAFKVLIRPETTTLVLPNGARAELKKGLTVSARFVVARRSLLQLLYEDVAGYFSPDATGLTR